MADGTQSAFGFPVPARKRAKRPMTRKHGLSYTPEYRAWQTMRHRCMEPSSPAWENYGGRGITICDSWRDSPATFIADMGLRPSPKHEIDRIDNDAGYSPENCRWVTRKVNDRNRRSNRMIEFQGETRSLAEWIDRLALDDNAIRNRIKAGWTADDAFTKPLRKKAAKGFAKHDLRHSCADCNAQIHLQNTRCITCSNKARARNRQGNALKAAA